MVLVITNNNRTIQVVTKYINIKEIILEDKIDDITTYVDTRLMSKTLECFDRIIIDITDLKETRENIVKAINRIKVVYNIQIIIVAPGYRIGNELLSDLFNINIYDFIISKDDTYQNEEWIKAIKGNNYIDGVKYKVETQVKKKLLFKKDKSINKKQVRRDKLLTCFSYAKRHLLGAIRVIGYVLLTILVSVGATALFNSSIRDMLIKILKGGV